MVEPTTLPCRNLIPLDETWDLASVFNTPEAWEAACRELDAQIAALAAFEGRLSEGANVLDEFIQAFQQAALLTGKILTYTYNVYSVDTGDSPAAARLGQAHSLVARFLAGSAFLNPELLAIGFDRLDEWLQSTPALRFIQHYLDDLRRTQQRVRSPEVEALLAQADDPFRGPSSVYSALVNADLAFQPALASDGAPVAVSQTSMRALAVHADRELRRTAWQSYADGYLAYKNTLAEALIASVKQDVFLARARGFDSCLHASLESDNIPVQVYHTLLDIFQKNLPTWKRYWQIRRKALGYDTLHPYDLKAPLTDKTPVVPFEQAVEWIAEGMAPLGEEYVRILRRGCLEERWVDRARNLGKREGAFSSGSPGTHPFIMLAYGDDLFSLSTLAHELGHSMHSYYTWLNQPNLYSYYSLFIAEVASNFNQAMVRDYLLRTRLERDFQVALIEEAMSNYHRYFFIMPLLARFEMEIHQRAEQEAPLNADVLNDLMADIFAEGYAGEVETDRPRSGITWAQFSHLYRNFYVYKYATGISGAHALMNNVLSGGADAAARYLDFLKAGCSLYPVDALKMAGVDLTSPEPVIKAFESLGALVDRLESLVG